MPKVILPLTDSRKDILRGIKVSLIQILLEIDITSGMVAVAKTTKKGINLISIKRGEKQYLKEMNTLVRNVERKDILQPITLKALLTIQNLDMK